MRVKKLLAMFLLVLLLCQPMLALQSLASAESSGYSEEPSIVRELTELRSTDSSTFLRDDGTYECVIYSEDKFYRNAGGEMTEIDNSIVNTNFTRNSLNYRFANAANDVRFFFADGETSSVSADYDGHFVSFIPINANNVIAVKMHSISTKPSEVTVCTAKTPLLIQICSKMRISCMQQTAIA